MSFTIDRFSEMYITEMEKGPRNQLRLPLPLSPPLYSQMLEAASIQRKSEFASSPLIETEYVISEELKNFIDSFKVI